MKNKCKTRWSKVELAIAKHDQLYYWAADWCKQNAKGVKAFYAANKEAVEKKIEELERKAE